MKRFFTLLAVALLAVCVVGSSADAKLREAKHTGFYITFGPGVGSLGVDYDNSDFTFDRETGVAFNLRLGWALRQNLLLGVESNAWAKTFDTDVSGVDATVTFSNTALALTYYPTEQLFLKAGPAFGNVDVNVEGDNAEYILKSDNGGGFMFGAGAELRLTTKFALLPSIQWTWTDINTDGPNDFKAGIFSFVIGVGWHW